MWTKPPPGVQLDWLLQAMESKVYPIVEKLTEQNGTLEEVLKSMESLWPRLENDISIRGKIEKVPTLTYLPEPCQVAQLFLELESLFARLTPGAMSEQEKYLVLLKKIHPKSFAEIRSDRFFKRRSETYSEMKEVRLSKTGEDWMEKQILGTLPKVKVNTLEEVSPPVEATAKGKGKGKGRGKGGGGKGGRGPPSAKPPLNKG